VITLGEAEGLVRRAVREGTTFAGHDHDHDNDHGHDNDHDHDNDLADAAVDMHLWLDPENAKVMVETLAARLARIDPANADAYAANAKATVGRLDALIAGIEARLTPLRGRPFVVFHDAYHYFEARFGLEATGAIAVSPEIMPGAERIRAIRAEVGALDAVCIFSEVQFDRRLIGVVAEGTGARTGTLDPLGAGIEAGPGAYEAIIRAMADAFAGCLAPTG
jgi:zinc transport system substrate-binding protein